MPVVSFWTPGCECCSITANLIKLDSSSGDWIWGVDHYTSGSRLFEYLTCNADSSGHVWSTNSIDSRLMQWDVAEGDLMFDGTNPAATTTFCSHVDENDNLYIGGNKITPAQSDNVFKLDSDGNSLWAAQAGSLNSAVSVIRTDSTGGVYARGGDYGNIDYGDIFKLDSGGSLVWTLSSDHQHRYHGIEIIGNTLYALTTTYSIFPDQFQTLYAYDLDGTQIDKNDLATLQNGSQLITNGSDLWATLSRVTRLETDATDVWTFPIGLGTTARGALDSNADFYCGMSNNTCFALDADGTQKWTQLLNGHHYSCVSGGDPVFGCTPTQYYPPI